MPEGTVIVLGKIYECEAEAYSRARGGMKRPNRIGWGPIRWEDCLAGRRVQPERSKLTTVPACRRKTAQVAFQQLRRLSGRNSPATICSGEEQLRPFRKPRMTRRVLSVLGVGGAIVLALILFALPASAELRTFRVRLATGQIVTVSVDAPAGLPMSQVPGLPGVPIQELTPPPPKLPPVPPLPTVTAPAPAPSPSPGPSGGGGGGGQNGGGGGGGGQSGSP